MTAFKIENFLTTNRDAVNSAINIASSGWAGFEKLTKLNLITAKFALLETASDSLAALSAPNPKDALAAQASLVKPMAEKTISYVRAAYSIGAETCTSFTDAIKIKASQGQQTLSEVIGTIETNAIPGSGSMIAALKTAASASQNAIDTVQSTTKISIEMADKRFGMDATPKDQSSPPGLISWC